MAAFFQLSDEIWSFIITLLATSANGAADLARFAATSKNFRRLSRNTALLKVVNFERISVDDYWEHRHLKDLLCLCARAGNLAAQSMLGKALLHNDAFFWVMILDQNALANGLLRHQRLVRRFISDASDEDLSIMRISLFAFFWVMILDQNALANGLLRHQRLVRRFISDASDEDLSIMRISLFSYMISFSGYREARGSGLLLAIAEMCSYYLEKRVNVVHDVPRQPLYGIDMAFNFLIPPSGRAHRALVLALFDLQFGVHERESLRH
ncbi:uncharacterized protein LOC143549933 [Bidens hawaiensis]|uniref:uncharacterized protein LOC143549933 n=1 Tax=Bidens hawaiensis TaxID=980011 RepID=UPI00404B7EAE